jgi:hypothetical protein
MLVVVRRRRGRSRRIRGIDLIKPRVREEVVVQWVDRTEEVVVENRRRIGIRSSGDESLMMRHKVGNTYTEMRDGFFFYRVPKSGYPCINFLHSFQFGPDFQAEVLFAAIKRAGEMSVVRFCIFVSIY